MFHNERVPTKGKAYHKRSVVPESSFSSFSSSISSFYLSSSSYSRCATCKTCEKNIGTKDILNGRYLSFVLGGCCCFIMGRTIYSAEWLYLETCILH